MTSTLNLSGADAVFLDSVSFADTNGDGRLDFTVGWYTPLNSIGGIASVTMNANGSSTLAWTQSYGLDDVTSYQNLVDVNGDGAKDFVYQKSDGAFYRLGSGTGSFGSEVSIGAIYGGLAGGDIDRDGDQDLTIGGTVLRNNGSGTFSATTGITTGNGYQTLVDMNGDGYLDLVDETSIYRNDGSGNFSLWGTHTAALSTTKPAFGIGDVNGDGVPDILALQSDSYLHAQLQSTQQNTQLERLDLSTQSSALAAITTLQGYFDRIASEVGSLGSSQSRLTTALRNLESTRENIASAHSRIMDADIANEAAELVKNQILQSVASSVLAQAKQIPQLAISLLKNS